MATLAELTTLVTNIIQDTSFSGSITAYLNQAVSEIAGGMQSSLGDFITPPLPELFTIGTVTTATDASYVAMPATFSRNLQTAVSSAGYEIDIYNSMINFSEDYPNLSTNGSINAVIEYGGNIYYQYIPSVAEDITVHFYRLPVAMEETTDIPDGIPLHLQRPLLVNHVAWKIFDLIEDGIEGPGVNTKKYMDLFLYSLRTLELSIPYDTRSFEAFSWIR